MIICIEFYYVSKSLFVWYKIISSPKLYLTMINNVFYKF